MKNSLRFSTLRSLPNVAGASTILLALLLPACGPRPCPAVPHEDAARAIRLHRSLHRTLRGLRAEARVDQRGDGGRIRGSALFLVARPDRLRFDIMTQLGPAATVTSDGTTFALLDHRENRFIHGGACQDNVEAVVGMSVPADAVANLILGEVPVIDGEQSIVCDNGTYRVTVTDSAGRRQELLYSLRPGDESVVPELQHLRLDSSHVYHADGRLDWSAEFDDYEVLVDPNDAEGRGIALPQVLRYVDPDIDADTEVRFREMEVLATTPDDNLFRQERPEGAIEDFRTCPPEVSE